MLFGVTIVTVLASAGVLSQHLFGDHVCKQEERYNVTIEQQLKKSVTTRVYDWCLNFPPRCSKYQTMEVVEPKIVVVQRTRMVDKCCDGYNEDSSRIYCIPRCDGCLHGVCTHPQTCTCEAGYTGPSCQQECSPTLWGPNCINECPCLHQNPCESTTGMCLCSTEWTGRICEFPVNKYTNSSKCGFDNCTTESNGLQNTSATVELENSAIVGNHSNVTQTEVLTPPDPSIAPPFNRQEPAESISSDPHVKMNNKTKIRTENITITTFGVESTSVNPVLNPVQTSKKNFNVTGKTPLFLDDNLNRIPNAEIRIEDQTPENTKNYFIVFVISLTVGVAIVLIIIAVMSIMIARYKKQRNLAKNCIKSKNGTNHNKNRSSTQPIVERSAFHAPLPDPPIFRNPVFTLREDKIDIANDTVTYSNYAESIAESQYDYPPSTGSYRAGTIIPDSMTEPVYDEIPAWRRPRPVNELPPTSQLTQVVPYRHSCCSRNSQHCEWNLMNT